MRLERLRERLDDLERAKRIEQETRDAVKLPAFVIEQIRPDAPGYQESPGYIIGRCQAACRDKMKVYSDCFGSVVAVEKSKEKMRSGKRDTHNVSFTITREIAEKIKICIQEKGVKVES